MLQWNFNKISGVEKLESIGYHAVLIAIIGLAILTKY